MNDQIEDIEVIVNRLSKWGVEGWNNHEDFSYKCNYLKVYFNYYPKLKYKCLSKRDGNNISINEKLFWNTINIYLYSIYDNL
jgi:hypothetical protein